MNKRIRVLLADDHQMFRESLIDFLANEFVCEDVVGAATVAEARTRIEAQAPDVAVCDLNFPGVESGYDLIAWIQENYPDTGILCLSMHSELQVLREVAKLRVRGFVTKSSGYNELFRAIRTIAEGGYYLDQLLLEKLMKYLGRAPAQERSADAEQDQAPNTSINQADNNVARTVGRIEQPAGWSYAPAELTQREQEIFMLFVENATLHDIADKLSLSPKTVENHRSNIYRKLNVHDRFSLLKVARERGLSESTR